MVALVCGKGVWHVVWWDEEERRAVSPCHSEYWLSGGRCAWLEVEALLPLVTHHVPNLCKQQ